MDPTTALRETAVPSSRPVETIDVADLPPPAPLRETLERVEALDDDTVLVQVNDRAPQHLYPQIEDRGYRFETVVTGEAVLTAIWQD